jgi:hypothetical protein
MNSIVCTNKTNDNETMLITVQTFLLHSRKLREVLVTRESGKAVDAKLNVFISPQVPSIEYFDS